LPQDIRPVAHSGQTVLNWTDVCTLGFLDFLVECRQFFVGFDQLIHVCHHFISSNSIALLTLATASSRSLTLSLTPRCPAHRSFFTACATAGQCTSQAVSTQYTSTCEVVGTGLK